MIYNDFQDMKLSMLGFGMMRLPLHEDKTIDEAQVADMIRTARENGVNYFDTAYPYHNGQSEIVAGKLLKDYPRDSFYLATKYPGHQIMDEYHPDEVFEEQLEKCGTDYFDFYLLHNINEGSIGTYMDEQWGIIDYFVEQKKLGRIRHLGFSTHGRLETMRTFLEYCKKKDVTMEFCQIQLNYLDWTLQSGKEKVALLNEYGVPVWVMEPIRGGKLKDDVTSAFRFLMDVPGVTVVLSGMSSLEQMKENVRIFAERSPLNDTERQVLLEKAESMKNCLPCTACRYCCDGCPMGLDIPVLIENYNDVKTSGEGGMMNFIESLPEDKKPSACIACGQCSAICPQNIDIPSALSELAEIFARAPKWADLSRERAEAAKKLKEAAKKG